MNPRIGRLVWIGDEVVLVAHNGDQWPIEWVSFETGGWGWDADGVARLPRPWRFDAATSEPVVEGDNVTIWFVNGHPKRPVVRGGLVKADRDAFLGLTFAEEGAEQVRVQLQPRDPRTGEVRGTVRAQAGPDDGSLVVEVLEPGAEQPAVELRLTPAGVEVRGQRVTLGRPGGAGAEPLIKGRPYLDDEADAAQQEAPLLAAAGAFFGLPFDEIVARAVRLGAASAGGAPYLSDLSETE